MLILLLLMISTLATKADQEIPSCEKVGTRYRNIEHTAISRVEPVYPPEPSLRVNGNVRVLVEIDRRGNVISARAICGHPLLQAASVKAALDWKFKPIRLRGRRYRRTGTISFYFSRQNAATKGQGTLVTTTIDRVVP